MAFSRQDISNGICTFLQENILAEGITVDESTPLADIGVDSFSLMEVILFLERQFQLVLPLEELTPETIQSVATLTDKCNTLLNEQPS